MATHSHSPVVSSKSANVRYQPLSDDELDQLAQLLDDLAEQGDLVAEDSSELMSVLSLAMVDGLFVALAMSPKNTGIADWMRLVMAGGVFENKELTQLCRNLLIRHYHSVVYLVRKTDMQAYTPCVSVDEEAGDFIDIQPWCAGFALGYEQQQEAWDACLAQDDMALSDLNLILAFKDNDGFGSDMETEAEQVFREAQSELISLMRSEVSELLQEPADDLTLLLFALQGLQDTMLNASCMPDVQQKVKSKTAHRQQHHEKRNAPKKMNS
jgi:yecA family protein